MARVMATAMADGNITETVVVTVDSNCNGNCRRQWQWAAETAMGGRDGNGKGVGNSDGVGNDD